MRCALNFAVDWKLLVLSGSILKWYLPNLKQPSIISFEFKSYTISWIVPFLTAAIWWLNLYSLKIIIIIKQRSNSIKKKRRNLLQCNAAQLQCTAINSMHFPFSYWKGNLSLILRTWCVCQELFYCDYFWADKHFLDAWNNREIFL